MCLAGGANERGSADDGTPTPGAHRRLGQQAVPGRDDVRRLGRDRTRRVDPHHPRGAGRRDQLHRHRRRLLGRRVGGDRRQGAQGPPRRGRAGHQARHARRRGRRPQPPRHVAALDHRRRSSTRCGAWAPTTSTSTRSTARRPRPTWRRRSARCRTSSTQGKIRYFGHSTYPASLIVEAQWTARDRRLVRPHSEQPPYSILTRGIENDVLPTCQRHGIGVIPWSPLAGRLAVGPLPQGRRASRGRRRPPAGAWPTATTCRCPLNQRKLDAADALAQLADEAGITLIQMAIAFVLNHPAVTAPIIGPRTMEHLESQLAAADVRAVRRRARPHRRDRAAGRHDQPRRRRLGQPGTGASGAPALS